MADESNEEEGNIFESEISMRWPRVVDFVLLVRPNLSCF